MFKKTFAAIAVVAGGGILTNIDYETSAKGEIIQLGFEESCAVQEVNELQGPFTKTILSGNPFTTDENGKLRYNFSTNEPFRGLSTLSSGITDQQTGKKYQINYDDCLERAPEWASLMTKNGPTTDIYLKDLFEQNALPALELGSEIEFSYTTDAWDEFENALVNTIESFGSSRSVTTIHPTAVTLD